MTTRTAYALPKQSLQGAQQQSQGINRRLVNLLPAPTDGRSYSTITRYGRELYRLIGSIEGQMVSCCVKITSSSDLSRAGILFLNGQVVACFYGRRGLGRTLFGQEALAFMTGDFLTHQAMVTYYELPQAVVKAAASLFQGQPLHHRKHPTLLLTYIGAVEQVDALNTLGCISVSNSKNEPVLAVFLDRGRVVGVYTSQTDWIYCSHTEVFDRIEAIGEGNVTAVVLPPGAVIDESSLGFSPAIWNSQKQVTTQQSVVA